VRKGCLTIAYRTSGISISGKSQLPGTREGLSMKSSIVKRSVRIDGHKTSVGLEDEFWNAFKQIAADQNTSIEELALKIDNEREHPNLSSAIRLFVLDYHCRRATIRSAADQQPKL
jgi:predicted DNA-binding ribbon-helix-helix protein